MELPVWLTDDLIKLVGMQGWHEGNKDRPSVAGVPSIDALF